MSAGSLMDIALSLFFCSVEEWASSPPSFLSFDPAFSFALSLLPRILCYSKEEAGIDKNDLVLQSLSQ
jgi:hypothetical protein